MGRQKLPFRRSNEYKECIALRCTKWQRQRLDDMRQICNMSISEYLRFLIESIEVQVTKEVKEPPKKESRPRMTRNGHFI